MTAMHSDAQASGVGTVSMPRAGRSFQRPDEIPLSPAQQEAWRLSNLGVPLNISAPIFLIGRLDRNALTAAVGDVISRFEGLRTTIFQRDSLPVQIVEPEIPCPELSALAVGVSTTGTELAVALSRCADLEAEIPIRCYIGRYEKFCHVLLVVVHHIAFDAWSHRPLVQALVHAYEARLDHQAPDWGRPSLRYADFALRQRSQAPERLIPFWSDPESLTSGEPDSATVALRLNPLLHSRVLALSRAMHTGVTTIIQAAITAVLSRLGFGDNIALGLVTSVRPTSGYANTVGLFQGTLLLQIDTLGCGTFSELLGRTHEAYVRACRKAGEQTAERSRHPARVMATVRSAAWHDIDITRPNLRWLLVPLRCSLEEFDIGFDLIERRGSHGAPEGIEGFLRHNKAILDRRGAESMISGLIATLAAVTETPNQPLRELPLAGGGEGDGEGSRRIWLKCSRKYVASSNATQHRLVRVWETVLGLSRISVEDDLVALGGTPESACAIVEQIAMIYGERFSPADMLRAGTIEEVTWELILRMPSSTVECVRSGNPNVLPGFFYLHGDFNGGGYYARELARELPPEQPFYVLHPLGMKGATMPSSLGGMADEYVEEIRRVQPHGPYCLGGFCIGGIIAVEVARRLLTNSEPVPLVVLVHSQYSEEPRTSSAVDEPVESANSPRERAAVLYSRYIRRWETYSPKPYPERLAVFWPEEEPFDLSPQAQWTALCPSVRTQYIPGSHLTCLTDYVREFGAHLRRTLCSSVRG